MKCNKCNIYFANNMGITECPRCNTEAIPKELARLEKKGKPGTELKNMITWFAEPKKNCSCQSREAKMNAWGPDGCEQRMTLISRWLLSSAKKASLPSGKMTKFAIAHLIKKAISNARKVEEQCQQ